MPIGRIDGDRILEKFNAMWSNLRKCKQVWEIICKNGGGWCHPFTLSDFFTDLVFK